MDAHQEYWAIYMAEAAAECGLALTQKQLECLAKAAENGYHHYDEAFYSPPPSEYVETIRVEYENKIKALSAEMGLYRDAAESAVKRALKISDSYHVTIEANGDVLRHGGRTDRIL